MKFSALLIGAACVAAMSGVANADPIVNLSLSVDTSTHTYKAFATITSNTGTTTSGLAGITFDIIGAGGAAVTTSLSDLPKGVNSSFAALGFGAQIPSDGINGVGIAGYQSNTYSGNAVAFPNVFFGVGLTAGSAPVAFAGSTSWGNPVQIAEGSYSGDIGTLSISSSSAVTTLLPSSLTSSSAAGNYATFSPAAVNGQTVSVAAVPEPASLGVLALGGLALLARRRKA